MSKSRLTQERPPLAVSQQKGRLVVEICVHLGTLIQVIQDLTRSDVSPDLEHRQYGGLLKGNITWRKPILNGKERRFSVEGVREGSGDAFTVVIYGAAAGFNGNGPEDLARALAHLGIGTEDFLIGLLCVPYPNTPRAKIVDTREAWREVISGSDFGPQYS